MILLNNFAEWWLGWPSAVSAIIAVVGWCVLCSVKWHLGNRSDPLIIAVPIVLFCALVLPVVAGIAALALLGWGTHCAIGLCVTKPVQPAPEDPLMLAAREEVERILMTEEPLT